MTDKPFALWMIHKHTGVPTRYGNYATYEEAMQRAMDAPSHLYESPRIGKTRATKHAHLLESESGHRNKRA